MAEVTQAAVDTAIATLKGAPDALLVTHEKEIAALAIRAKAGDVLAAAPAVAPESPEAAILVRYKQEYDSLPGDVRGRLTWEAVTAKLMTNEGAKLKKADAMQGGGYLFHITESGDVLIKDKGVEPVMYGWDKPEGEEGRQLVQIYGRQAELMAQIKQWANAPEIEARITADGYELFEDDGNYRFSEEMQRAADANDGKLFVASQDRREWRETVLKKGRDAFFNPYDGYVDVYGIHPENRNAYRGAVRLLRV